MSAAAHTVANITTTGTITATGAIASSAGVSGTTGSFTTSLAVGSGTAITKIIKSTVSVVVAATAAAGEEDVEVTVTGATAGDLVIATPLNATAETGLACVLAWVSQADKVKLRFSNLNAAAALSGSTSNWQIGLIRS